MPVSFLAAVITDDIFMPVSLGELTTLEHFIDEDDGCREQLFKNLLNFSKE